ncbi:hypothetical protein VSH64_25260 [Amycolatopsis rhabdoformis]|uniref:DUF1877 family protein n=1 Tax=Amycolatopsis rhabdoformis TaxID=1448059 RepID=A0ABZ1HXD7_9PSEU|nr:hypothetical protein [Amycolatopsis rhabdoformis]WSE26186.1 hypothetical protein VSH64_25260 [Amycolatopsis rhabdoformis]
MLYDYFVAVDDAMAARTFTEPDTARCEGYPELAVKGADPFFDLLPVEAVLTGRTIDEVEADPAHCPVVEEVGDGEAVVLSLAESFRDGLATADDDALRVAAVAFVERNERGAAEDLVAFLKELGALAQGAKADGHRLYCTVVV